MGRGCASPWLLLSRPVVMVFFLGIMTSFLPVTVGECAVEHCWNLFQSAQRHLGVRDEFPLSNHASSMSRQRRHDLCLVRRTFYICVRNKSRSCRSDLSYHSVKRGLENQLRQLRCNLTGPVFHVSDLPSTTPTPPPQQDHCTHRSHSNRTHAYCALYGDPHLRTLDGQYMTCRSEGVWPLLDNDYVTVQVTNERLRSDSYTAATLITEVTVVVKRHECAIADDYLLYVSYGGYLPAHFIDGSSVAGPDGAVVINDVTSGRHVELRLRYIDTTIVLRQTSDERLSVGVRMPQEIVDETMSRAQSQPADFLPVQLCVNGCPRSERIDYREILVESHLTSAADDRRKQVLHTAVVPRDIALERCQRAGLIDYYLDSCVFDLMLTDNLNVTAAVQLAQTDEFRLVPELAKQHLNRTALNRTELAEWETEYVAANVNAASSGAQRVSYVTAVFCILFISHLNYLHKTTYVLLRQMLL